MIMSSLHGAEMMTCQGIDSKYELCQENRKQNIHLKGFDFNNKTH